MTPRAWLWVAAATLTPAGIPSCDRRQPLAPFRASGSIVFDEHAAESDRVDVFLATETEVIKSRPQLQHVVEELRLDLALDAGKQSATDVLATGTTVGRRGASLVLDVSVSLPAGELASVAACNALLETYLTRRQEMRIERATVLEEQLEGDLSFLEREDAGARSEAAKDLRRQIAAAEAERRRREEHARVLEPCTARSTGQ